MAEFQEIIKQFRRMCWYYQRQVKCDGCPMAGCNISQCRKLAFDCPDETEIIVTKWAAEHQPVYPNWWEWLASIGAVTRKVKPDVASALIETGLLDPIHADIAQKLGIAPKEE